MSTYLGLLKGSPDSSSPGRHFSPFRVLALLVILILAAETVAMVILFYVPATSYATTTLLDGLIMLVMVLPGLYFLQLRPLVNQIQERTQAEMALRDSEQRLQKILELLPVGVWIIDKAGNIVQGNPASYDIWAGARYVGPGKYTEYKGWWPDSGEAIRPEEWAAARALVTGEISLNEEVNIEAFDGARKVILNSAVPIVDEHDSLQGVVVVNQDITLRRQMERALVEKNQLLERFFHSIHTLIAYLDRDFNFVRVNEAYARSSGHPVDFFPGKNHFDLYPHPENEAIFRRVVESGEPFSILEKSFEYPDYPERGVTYWDWSLQPVGGTDGVVEGLVFSLIDVTERKRAELQLEERNQELLELSKAEQRLRELAESLVQSVVALNSSLQLDEVLASILEQIRRTIPFQGAEIMLVEDSTLRVAGYSGFEAYPASRPVRERSYLIEDFPLLSQICLSLQPIVIEDTNTHPEWRIGSSMEWVSSYVAAPLVAGNAVIGIINLVDDRPCFFNEQIVERLGGLAAPASAALRNAQLYEAELTARQTAENLSAAAVALAQTLDLDQVLHLLMDYVNRAVASDVHGIGLLNGEGRLAVRVAHGYPSWSGPDYILSFPTDEAPDWLLNRLISTRKSQLVTDTALHPLVASDPDVEQVRSWLLVPIVAHDKAIGLVALGKILPGYFGQKHIRMVEALVAQAAVAIQNAWLFQQVRSSNDRLQSLARKLVEVQESERYYIARELHDEAGQALSSLKLNLGRLQQEADCPLRIREKLEDLKGVADGVLEDLHRLAVDLRPIALDHLGLVAALEQHAGNLGSARLSIQFKALGFEGSRLPRDMETSLYRIVQEALSNVVHHAQASNVGILLERDHGRVKIFVEDDGIGFDAELPEYGRRLGLVGMRERAEMFGGTLTIESTPGKGTSIIVEVPDASSDSHR
jgi:PAS domain S-box-containing protein